MTAKNLVFQLHGSMTSWGTSDGEQNRTTGRVPTKSAVMGLLASALGYTRSQEQKHRKLTETLQFGLAVESYGSQMRDYHTSMPPEEKAPYLASRRDELKWGTGDPVVTHRAYRMDGFYTVVLSAKNPDPDLNRITEALNKPHFTPYLGRKSCPPSIRFSPRIYSDCVPLEAILQYWDDRILHVNPNGLGVEENPDEFDFFLEGRKGTVSTDGSYNIENARERKRRDQLVSREQWTFENRWEEQVHVRRT